MRLPTVFLSALEPSADLHAANLIAAIRAREPETRFLGVGGPKMREAGCETLFDLTTRSAMLLGAVGLVAEAFRMLCRIDRLFGAGVADVFVPVDSPTFNLPVSLRAKARGLPVVYFIAPQVWAWAEFRIHKVRKRTDRLAVILPFEEPYFRSHGINATFVGHPLIESLARTPIDTMAVSAFNDLGEPLVTCMPGSRGHVVDEVLPGQIEVCQAIVRRHPNAAFVFAAASRAIAQRIARTLDRAAQTQRLRCQIVTGRNAEAISAADLVLVASGTATLEVAYHNRPMIVMYNASKWGYRLIGRRLIRTEHLSLVNILARRRIVPEFMPYYDSTAPITQVALEILANPSRQAAMRDDLADLIQELGSHDVAQEAAAIVLDVLRAQPCPTRHPALRGSRHRVW
ncbi:MAG: lipid-A-disaccharide synthase [Phycisphaerae bacterium]|nr:lipid-A-disaccharide synthase [Phycisphaerae bacterium]